MCIVNLLAYLEMFIDLLRSFNEDVRRVVDKAVEHGENSLWATLKNRASARDTAVSKAERAAREAQEKIGECSLEWKSIE